MEVGAEGFRQTNTGLKLTDTVYLNYVAYSKVQFDITAQLLFPPVLLVMFVNI